jgi:cellulose synthase/poly-beta-1,6-N-acetylglucosamine synthase-like glycosyltransferase
MLVICIILTIILSILSLPVFVLFVQVWVAVFLTKKYTHKHQNMPLSAEYTVVVLMPAHNEKLVIQRTIQSILPQLRAQDRLLVVADNCSDETSTIASSLGAHVLERTHSVLRGKSYALDFGIQSLKKSPPDVVIIVDADCIVGEGAIKHLAHACLQSNRPVQALYLMELPQQPTIKARIAQLAWVVKNKVRPTGFHALGFPCQLMGTGMAFLWQDLMQVNLASGHIAEDMKLGADLAKIQKAPLFLADALVTSVFPDSPEAVSSQRTRWEHGHLSVMLTESPGLLIEAIRNHNFQALGLFLDLIVPPIALLILLCVAVLTFVEVLNIFVNATWFLIWALFLLVLVGLTIILAWYKFGRAIISLKQLCFAPIYAIGKLGLYLKFIVNRQVEWVRSKRD